MARYSGGMRTYPAEVRAAARSLYLRRFKIKEIAHELGIPRRTLYHWADADDWESLLSHEAVEESIHRRMALLVEREGKEKTQLEEIDRLVGVLERVERIKARAARRKEQEGMKKVAAGALGGSGQGRRRSGRKTKNDVSGITADDFKEKFHSKYFSYQFELRAARMYRNRQILKSRQIGATWYFAQEAFEDAVLTGDNQIFLSATRAQAEVFRSYIIELAREHFKIELSGNPIVLNTAKGPATLYFLSNNSKSAQSYHGHVYIDEFFWIIKFNELYKVATGMAAHKKWRRTLFSTPSAVTHDAYDLWTGDRFQKRFKRKRVDFPGFEKRQSGILCPDNTWRKIITLEDAIAGGCNLFDIKDLKLEYSPDEFRNLFMCRFVDDTMGVFRLADLEACYADPDKWTDYRPGRDLPFGTAPVWGGYDPSRSRDDATFVVMAPPIAPGGDFRILERYKWVDKSFTWQAERIKELCQRFHFAHMGIDTTGPGLGVFDIVRNFFPLATPIHYSLQTKTQLVLKAKEVIGGGRLKWSAAWNEIPHAFLTIRQGATDSGLITYNANRTAKTGHADVAWAIMHAIGHEPLAGNQGGCIVEVG